MTPIRLSQLAERTPESPISYFMRLALEDSRLISIAAGFVDEPSLPALEIEAAIKDLFSTRDSARAALQYGTTQGYLPLRQKLVERFARADGTTASALNLSPANVVVTNGSQQLLYMVSEILLDPGDIVITEAPSYFVYHGTLASRGVRVMAVPMDDQGMKTDALEELLNRIAASGELSRLKLIYTVDYFQNPSGLTLSAARRAELMRLVRSFSRDHRILVLEDAAYRELRFAGDDIPSIKSLDPENQFVIYTSTFSKPCAPGLKTGYGFLPTELVDPIICLKGGHDFGSSNLNQHIADRMLSTGVYDRHAVELQAIYRQKAEAMLEALAAAFLDHPEIRWTRPTGGLYVWLKFPPHVQTGMGSELLRASMREGVLYIPGEYCHVAGDDIPLPSCEARLCFGVATIEQIREAIKRLGKAACALLDSKREMVLS
jgi:2-aminoadipate transaminase